MKNCFITMSVFFQHSLSTLLLSFVFLGYSCNEDNVSSNQSPKVIALNIGVIDVWLRVVSDAHGTLTLKRDNDTLLSNLEAPLDTMILDENLLPKHTYTYRIGSGSSLTVTTMDTTSHQFQWELTRLGDGASSVLYDVTIINDTLAYAVGEIYKRDSTGQWETEPYGLAKWDGNGWKLQRLRALSPTGTYYSILRPKGIFVFSQTNIWFANGGVFRWNGEGEYVTPYWVNAFAGNSNPILSPGQGAEKLWGRDSTNIYMVGTNGALASYNRTEWSKIESGTNVNINDIWGVKYAQDEHPLIFATASNIVTSGEQKILRINEQNIVNTIPWNTGRDIHSICFFDTLRLFTSGGGVFERKPNKVWREITSIPLYYTRRIRGNAINDIVVVGDFGIVAHGNGASWRVYPEAAAALYYSCDYKNNIFIAVGSKDSRAVILRGYKH